MNFEVDSVAHLRPGDKLIINLGEGVTASQLDQIKKVFLDFGMSETVLILGNIQDILVVDRDNSAQAIALKALLDASYSK